MLLGVTAAGGRLTPSLQASQRITCDGQRAMVLPDDREVALEANSSTWPPWDSTMPWVERVEQWEPGKDVVVLEDNTATIDHWGADDVRPGSD